LTRDEEVLELVRYALENGIRLDMLLNVAGLDYEGGFTARRFDQIAVILRVNIEATLRVTHEALALRRPGSPFYVVFVSSLASMVPMPLKATYAASKRFLLDFSIALGQELKDLDIRVLSLCPAGLPTTETSIRGIAAQGFWGSVTTNKLERVVRRTLDRVMDGRRVYIPGLLNRVIGFAGKLLPPCFVARILYVRWSCAQRQWLTT
jgi:short-subunit dehydrogenase